MPKGGCGHALRTAPSPSSPPSPTAFGLQASYALALLLELLKLDKSLHSLLERSPDPLDCGFACVLLPCLCAPALALHGFGGAWVAFLSLGFLWCSAVAKRGPVRGPVRGPGRGPDGGRELVASVATLELLTGFATFALAYALTLAARAALASSTACAARAALAFGLLAPILSPNPNPNPNPSPQPQASAPALSLSSPLAPTAAPTLTRYALAWGVGLLSLDALVDFSLGASPHPRLTHRAQH